MTPRQINKRLKALEGKAPDSEAWQNLLCDIQEEMENTQEKIDDLETNWELTEKQEERLEALKDKQEELERVFDSLDDGSIPEPMEE